MDKTIETNNVMNVFDKRLFDPNEGQFIKQFNDQ